MEVRAAPAAAAPVVETTEFRVCSTRPPPDIVERWVADWRGGVERRRDVYFLDGRHDVGVKRRGGTTLELKLRHAIGPVFELATGLQGRTEVWRKWSPADGLVDVENGGRWVGVRKSIVRRRFDIGGAERIYTTDAIPEWPGCDIEVVRVGIGSSTGWTFAFTAFGPSQMRLEALRVAWVSIAAPEPIADELRTYETMGYPEWLSREFAHRRTSASDDHRARARGHDAR